MDVQYLVIRDDIGRLLRRASLLGDQATALVPVLSLEDLVLGLGEVLSGEQLEVLDKQLLFPLALLEFKLRLAVCIIVVVGDVVLAHDALDVGLGGLEVGQDVCYPVEGLVAPRDQQTPLQYRS